MNQLNLYHQYSNLSEKNPSVEFNLKEQYESVPPEYRTFFENLFFEQEEEISTFQQIVQYIGLGEIEFNLGKVNERIIELENDEKISNGYKSFGCSNCEDIRGVIRHLNFESLGEASIDLVLENYKNNQPTKFYIFTRKENNFTFWMVKCSCKTGSRIKLEYFKCNFELLEYGDLPKLPQKELLK